MSNSLKNKVHVLHKEDFIYLCREAIRLDYNRQMDVDKVAEEDSELFGLRPLMLHEHVAGEKQDPDNFQVRTMVYVNNKEKDKADMIGYLDVNIRLWTMMTRGEDIKMLIDTDGLDMAKAAGA